MRTAEVNSPPATPSTARRQAPAECGDVCIRPYRASDEPAIRDICYATGFLGAGVSAWLDVNKALFTDFWLEYHFRREPEMIFVAEMGGRSVGYAAGCRDTRARERFMRLPFGLHFMRSLARGRYRMGRRAMSVSGRLLSDLLTVGFPRTPAREYPAHLHYNVLPEARSRSYGCGLRLAGACFQRLLDQAITRCYGLVVMPARQVGRRYDTVGHVYDARATRIFGGATREKLCMVTLVFDLPEIARRYPRYFERIPQGGCVTAPCGREAPA